MHNTNTTYIISQLCRWVISSISLIILIETDLDCWRKGSQFSIANCTGTSWTYSPHFWARWVGQHVMGGNHFFLPIRGLNLLSSYVLNFVSSLNFWGIVRYVGERAGGARHGRARDHEGECQRGQHKWEFTIMLVWSEPRAWIQDLHHRLWTSKQGRSDDGGVETVSMGSLNILVITYTQYIVKNRMTHISCELLWYLINECISLKIYGNTRHSTITSTSRVNLWV